MVVLAHEVTTEAPDGTPHLFTSSLVQVSCPGFWLLPQVKLTSEHFTVRRRVRLRHGDDGRCGKLVAIVYLPGRSKSDSTCLLSADRTRSAAIPGRQDRPARLGCPDERGGMATHARSARRCGHPLHRRTPGRFERDSRHAAEASVDIVLFRHSDARSAFQRSPPRNTETFSRLSCCSFGTDTALLQLILARKAGKHR